MLDLQAAVRAILKKASKASAIEHGDYNMLKAIAVAAGIPESDVPTQPTGVTVKNDVAALI